MPRKLRSGTSEAYQPGLVEQTRDLLVEAAIRQLKATPGRELQVHGSGQLLRWLLERDLVDELNLRIYPVLLGDGLRLFADRGPTHHLELLESRSLPSGVTLQTYRPAGRASFGDVGEERTAGR